MGDTLGREELVPWKESNRMDIRYELLNRLAAGERVTDLAREYGVSRKTVYKYKARWERDGLEGLRDQSRRPVRLARKLPAEVEEAVMKAKRRYPKWGAKKIRSRLPALFPGLHVPAASTIHLILDRHGAVERRRRRSTVAQSTTVLSPPKRPNHVWGADFKGQFRLGDRS